MTMREMAREYRATAAWLNMRIQQHEQAGDRDPAELATMRSMLADLRMVARTLSGYYDIPRPGEVDGTIYYGRGPSEDDH